MKRAVYPMISRLAHRELSIRNEAIALEELARIVGLNGVHGLLPRLLDGRFKLHETHVTLWAWERDFPALNETVAVLDLEATGGHMQNDEIIEIGAVKLGPDGYHELNVLNDPGRPIPPFIVKLTGINDAMVRGAPPLEHSLERLAGFLEGTTVVIQNATFDLAFLEPRFARLGIKLQSPVVDTINLARRTLPGKRRRGLDSLASLYGVKIEARHRAIGDARATLGITRELYHALTAGRSTTLHALHDELLESSRAKAHVHTDTSMPQTESTHTTRTRRSRNTRPHRPEVLA